MELYRTCENYAKRRRFYSNAYLSLLLGGPLGAHHFYLRRIKSGLAMVALSLGILLITQFEPVTRFNSIVLTSLLVALAGWMFSDLFLIPKRVDWFNEKLFDRVRHHKINPELWRRAGNALLYALSLLPITVLVFSLSFSFVQGFFQGLLGTAYPTMASTEPTLPSPTTETLSYAGELGTYTIEVDGSQWQWISQTIDEQSDYEWQNVKTPSAFALVMSQNKPFSIEEQKQATLESFELASETPVVILQEKQATISGQPVLQIDLKATIDNTPMLYHNTYWGGKGGTVQIITFAPETEFDKVLPEFNSLLETVMITPNT